MITAGSGPTGPAGPRPEPTHPGNPRPAEPRPMPRSAHPTGPQPGQPTEPRIPDQPVPQGFEPDPEPRQICWATHEGMLCDRMAGHLGWHVDVFGPDIPDHIWPPDDARPARAALVLAAPG